MKTIRLWGAGCALLLVCAGSAAAQDSGAFGDFGNSNAPVRIDAKSLEVIDREQTAIYSGDVVATQGDAVLRCTTMTILYSQRPAAGQAQGEDEPAGGVRRLECKGPLSAVSGTSTVTGDNGVYEAKTRLVTVTGNVIMTDCGNVQKGDKLVYNMDTGVATVTGGRVSGVFNQGGGQGEGCQ